jgi:hypothetical protein
MESDVINLNALNDAVNEIILSGTLKGRVSVKRFLWICGARRTKETKKDGIWWTTVKVLDKNKWLLAKIKYGF